jgi:hypothetical protein
MKISLGWPGRSPLAWPTFRISVRNWCSSGIIHTTFRVDATQEKVRTRSKHTALISLLTFLLVAVIGTPSYADLGLDSSDFGSQPASGKKVSGAKLPTDTQGQGAGDTKKTNSANDGSSEDTPGKEGPFCRLNTGTENAEDLHRQAGPDRVPDLYPPV